MKKINFLFGISLVLLLFNSCNKDSNFEDDYLNSEEPSKEISLKAKYCDNPIDGLDFVRKGSVATYTITTISLDTNPKIKWTTTPGIKILSGQNSKTLRVRFSSNFTSGRITANLNDGQCGAFKGIKVRKPANKCPSRLDIRYAAGRNGCDDFLIELSNGQGVRSVSYYYSIKHIRNRLFKTNNYKPGNRITAPLYLPTGIDFNNHDLWVKARVTLQDGSTCALKNKILLKCSKTGGNY